MQYEEACYPPLNVNYNPVVSLMEESWTHMNL